MNPRRWNWRLWTGFLLCVVGFASYLPFFARFPVTRDVPWVNFALLAAGLVLLFAGLRHAFGDPQRYRGKIFGSVFTVLGVAMAAFFCYAVFHVSRQLPASADAPHVGQHAPEFELMDIHQQPVSLAKLLTTPLPRTGASPKGVLLVFYRGYW